MKTALIVLTLMALLGASAWFAFSIMDDMPLSLVSGPGLIALALGIIVSLGLGGGLMALSYYSHKRGYDDDAHDQERFSDKQ